MSERSVPTTSPVQLLPVQQFANLRDWDARQPRDRIYRHPGLDRLLHQQLKLIAIRPAAVPESTSFASEFGLYPL